MVLHEYIVRCRVGNAVSLLSSAVMKKVHAMEDGTGTAFVHIVISTNSKVMRA